MKHGRTPSPDSGRTYWDRTSKTSRATSPSASHRHKPSGGTVATVAPAVVNDSKERTQHEVDVVAVGRERNGSRPILALGEAKHTESKRTLSDLTRLKRIRELVSAKNPSATKARLLLFSAKGFDANLTRESARRDDIELVDIGRLYNGA